MQRRRMFEAKAIQFIVRTRIQTPASICRRSAGYSRPASPSPVFWKVNAALRTNENTRRNTLSPNSFTFPTKSLDGRYLLNLQSPRSHRRHPAGRSCSSVRLKTEARLAESVYLQLSHRNSHLAAESTSLFATLLLLSLGPAFTGNRTYRHSADSGPI